MKTLALYGFASATREGIWQSNASEVWSVVWAYKYDVPRLDRIFEMHPIWFQALSQKPEYQKARDHWEWLKENRRYPIYMMVKHPSVPLSIRYPIEAVQSLLPSHRRRSVFTSSFDYMMGMAILEGFDRIELYGFEMGSDTEYRYQREGASYWIAQADARGIDVILPDNTALLKKKMYGYEGGSMIYRQSMEMVLSQRRQQKVNEQAKLNNLEGQMRAAVDQFGEGSERANQIAAEWDKQYRLCYIVDGAVQQLEMLLKNIDLEEPSDEFIDTFGVVKMEG